MDIYPLLAALCSETFPTGKISGIQALTPDASSRTYYRIAIEGLESLKALACPATVIAMCFSSLRSPEYEGAVRVPADEAYVTLSRYFAGVGIPVPQLFADFRSQGVLLIEDVGDRTLAHLLAEPESRDIALGAYERAIEVMVLMQALMKDERCVGFSRRFSFETFYHEMQEFVAYVIQPHPQASANAAMVEECIVSLAKKLEEMPQVLTHRDYHGWNLLLDPFNELRVIDFQDALLAPRAYDLVGLLNDRDIDSALGIEAYRWLLGRYVEESKQPETFLNEYDAVLLQRDLKVAGRFAKLSSDQGLQRYAQWIPGTLRRIGRTLSRMDEQGIPETQSLASALLPYFADLESGYGTGPWY